MLLSSQVAAIQSIGGSAQSVISTAMKQFGSIMLWEKLALTGTKSKPAIMILENEGLCLGISNHCRVEIKICSHETENLTDAMHDVFTDNSKDSVGLQPLGPKNATPLQAPCRPCHLSF